MRIKSRIAKNKFAISEKFYNFVKNIYMSGRDIARGEKPKVKKVYLSTQKDFVLSQIKTNLEMIDDILTSTRELLNKIQ
jgi:hypothetical protein